MGCSPREQAWGGMRPEGPEDVKVLEGGEGGAGAGRRVANTSSLAGSGLPNLFCGMFC